MGVPAVVKPGASKAAVVVEAATEPESKPDGNGSCVAISTVIGVIRFGVSVGGRLIIGGIVLSIEGWVGRRGGGITQTVIVVSSIQMAYSGDWGAVWCSAL